MRGLTSAQCLAVIRMGLGVYFLSSASQKLTGNYLSTGAPLQRTLDQAVGSASNVYQPFLSGVVLPHVDQFAVLVALGELCVGISLTLGLLTRAGALVGIWLNLNYMFMKGMPNYGGSMDRFMILVQVLLIVGSAGLVWGLDGKLATQLGHLPVIGWLAGANREVPPERERRVPSYA